MVYIPGPELEWVCQNKNTLCYIHGLLSFAAVSRPPGEAMFSGSWTYYLPAGKTEGVSLTGGSAWDNLLPCPWKGGVLGVFGGVQSVTLGKRGKSVFQAFEYTSQKNPKQFHIVYRLTWILTQHFGPLDNTGAQ